MREAIFYQLLQNFRKGNEEHIPVHRFMGDVYCEELNLGGFVSHECSARVSEINKDNPELLQIKKQKAKYTNNHYYCYRINPYFSPSLIRDPKLRQFYDDLQYEIEPHPPVEEKKCPHGLPVFVQCPHCN